MFTLPFAVLHVIVCFAPLFSKRVWKHTKVLLIGAILAPGKRTVTSALHVMGLRHETHFQNDHRVLNRAVWSSLAASRLLLGVLVVALAPTGRLVRGLDDRMERRRGEKMTAKGISRDPVRSAHAHFVKASGLRWLSAMLLVPIPWAQRVWALPFFTALCPSERYHQERGRRHTNLTDRARQILRLVQRWQPQQDIVGVADRSFAALELLHAVRDAVTVVTRLRLDAALYDPAPERPPGHRGRPRKQGNRLPTLTHLLDKPQAVWRPVSIENWYGQGPRVVETTTGTGVW
jgi:DDE superfamily endonuclease